MHRIVWTLLMFLWIATGTTFAQIPIAKNYNVEFRSEEVSFPNRDIRLAGTLTLPKTNRKKIPAVVIITGSGSQDRDGSQLFNLYKTIAESLSQAGVAVLRVDDRGMGRSTIVKEKASETSYRDIISDTIAAVNYLAGRPEIDGSKICLLGHSEGAETALTIASENRAIAALILLSGTSRPISETVTEQDLYQRAMVGTISVADKTTVNPISQVLIKIFDDARQPQNAKEPKLSWFREHLTSDPSRIARTVKCPVLIVQGERDALVLAYHSIQLATALVATGNANVSLRLLPNLTHIFTPVLEDQGAASQISSDLTHTLQAWVSTNLLK